MEIGPERDGNQGIMKDMKMTYSITTIRVLLLIFLVVLSLPETCLAMDFELEWESFMKFEKNGNNAYSTFFGNLSVLFFLIGSTYVLAKLILAGASYGTGKSADDMSSFLGVHIVSNLLGVLCTFIHAYNASASSIILIISEIIMVCLVLGGLVLRSMVDRNTASYSSLILKKRIFSTVFFLLIIIGHILVIE